MRPGQFVISGPMNRSELVLFGGEQRQPGIRFEVFIEADFKCFNSTGLNDIRWQTFPYIYNTIEEKVFGFICSKTVTYNFKPVISGDM